MRRLATTGVIAIALLTAVAAALGLVHWSVTDAGLRQALLRQMTRASGFDLAADGPITLRLLPRPMVQISGVAIRGLDGAVALDAEVMRGRLDLTPLLMGRLRVVAVVFERPTAVVDLDRVLPRLASRAERADLLRSLQSAGVTLHGGVIRLMSHDISRDALLTDVAGIFEWPADDAEGRLAGTATWHATTAEITADLARPGALGEGGQTLASVRLRSAALDFDAHGILQGGEMPRAVGQVTAATGDLPGFLRLIGHPTPQLDAIRGARITAGLTLAGETLSLDDAALGLDDMLFEGALTVHQRGDETSLAGTLASEHVDLDRFLDALPAFTRPDGTWAETPLQTGAVADDDIDLRVSATTARIGPFTIEDGSFSLQSGGGRMELSLGEARAYDGLLKGRVVATADGRATDLRADVTLSRLDLDKLTRDVPGGYSAAGILTGHLGFAAQGAAPADLARALACEGQISLHNGALGTELLAALVHPGRSSGPMPAVLPDSTLRLDTAAVAFDGSAGGRVVLKDSWVAWDTGRATLAGFASIPDQRLELRAAVTSEEAPEADAAFTISGPWQALRLDPERPPF